MDKVVVSLLLGLLLEKLLFQSPYSFLVRHLKSVQVIYCYCILPRAALAQVVLAD